MALTTTQMLYVAAGLGGALLMNRRQTAVDCRELESQGPPIKCTPQWFYPVLMGGSVLAASLLQKR